MCLDLVRKIIIIIVVVVVIIIIIIVLFCFVFNLIHFGMSNVLSKNGSCRRDYFIYYFILFV